MGTRLAATPADKDKLESYWLLVMVALLLLAVFNFCLTSNNISSLDTGRSGYNLIISKLTGLDAVQLI